MFKVKNKKLRLLILSLCLILLVSLLFPAIRAPFLNSLKQPLILLTLVRREFGAIIFYHRNFTQNELLKKEADFLKYKLNLAEENNLENMRLKELLAFKNKSPFKLIAARVIGRSADSWSSSLIIDKGRRDGIRRKMIAVSYLGLVGRVNQAQGSTSRILLINDPNIAISCLVQRSRQEGLVSGALGANLIMKYLPEASDIKVGDYIVTSGLNQVYPKGLLVGEVIQIGKEFSGLSRFAIIKPAVNLSSIEEVLIIVSY